jgi:hypothetical protein
MKKKYFIKQYSFVEYFHGGVGFADAEKILLTEGFVPILFPCHKGFSISAKVRRFFYLLRMLFVIPKGAVIVFLFPVYARMNRSLIKGLLRKGVRFICVVADIDSLRDGDRNELKKEIDFLRSFKYFIVHTENMRQWLNDNLPGKRSEVLIFFDFLTVPFTATAGLSFNIAFAGNLAKSGFLEKLYLLPPPLHFHLYGTGQTEAMLAQKNISWHGVEQSYSLPEKIQGSFGLVWDGESIHENAGPLGDYIRLNSPHKFSLYVMAGLPVIAHHDAGIAGIIDKYEIGFSVNSLHEIHERISLLNKEQYQVMQKNCCELAKKISTGKYLKNALEKLL